MIIAVAGRRIDAANADTARFPLQNVPLVEQRLRDLFAREAATAVVGSAACGADLVAMATAGAQRLRRRVVLPFHRDRFRVTSVTDRPGEWEPTYDRLLAELDRTGDVVTLEGHGEGDEAYAAANEAILQEAARLAHDDATQILTVIVWEGAPRPGADLTAAFAEHARKRTWRVEPVKTL